MMQFFSQALEGTSASRDLITAVSLASWEMERTKNIGTKTERLKKIGDAVWPLQEEPPLELNGRGWRIHRILGAGSDPLQVTIEVRLDGQPNAVARLVTLISDTIWEKKVNEGA